MRGETEGTDQNPGWEGDESRVRVRGDGSRARVSE